MQLSPIQQHSLSYQGRQLDLSYPHIMGILNMTPDSFSDGGLHNHKDRALRYTEVMINAGATIIDVGGESTRPNAAPVSEAEELDRTVDIVEAIRRNFDVWISVDTSTPAVMQACSEMGAGIWNDVRALTRPRAVDVAAKLAIPVILMHMRGEPTTMNQLDHYDNVIDDVMAELQQRIDTVVAGGVQRENLIIDPGFGFAKNYQQNLQWLDAFSRLQQFDLPLMVAISRKRSMGEALRQASLPSDIHDRDGISMVAGLLAVQQGACIVRTHNVAMTKAGLALWQAVTES